MQTQTVSAYERLHGVPEPMTAAKMWARQGFVSVETIRQHARFGMGKTEGHAHDIGTYAMRGVLSTLTCYKAVTENDGEDRIVPYHLVDTMEIFHKIVERDEMGKVVAVRPGMTQEEFLDDQRDPRLLLDPEQWVVSRDSLRDGYYQLGPEKKEDDEDENKKEAKNKRVRETVPPRLGMFVIDGKLVRVELPNFGEDEKTALEWATLGA